MADDARGAMRHYENGEIRVIWRPDLCAHSGVCVRGLAEVFRPRERPWIDLGGRAQRPDRHAGRAMPVGRPVVGAGLIIVGRSDACRVDVTRNDERHRFEVAVDGHIGRAHVP